MDARSAGLRGDDDRHAGVGGSEAERPGATAEGAGGPWFVGGDYRVQAGDTLWGLARDHYLNPFYWPHIWNRNAGLADPNRIEVEQALRLPPLQGPPRQLAAADRESIAEGYLRLYRFRRARNADNAGFALVGARFFDAAVLPSDLRARGSTGNPATRIAAFRDRFHSAFPATRAD